MAKPPPLPSERRKHPRVGLIAQVQVKRGGEVEILQARNVSIGGVFLEGEPRNHPQLALGVELDLALVPEDDAEGHPIIMRAKVARVERGAQPGFGVSIIRIDTYSQGRLSALVRRGRETS